MLLTLAYNVITPSADGHGVPPNLTPFFDDVEDVDNYAWAAALLSTLYSSLKNYKEKGINKLEGNLWVVLVSDILFIVSYIIYVYSIIYIDILFCLTGFFPYMYPYASEYFECQIGVNRV